MYFTVFYTQNTTYKSNNKTHFNNKIYFYTSLKFVNWIFHFLPSLLAVEWTVWKSGANHLFPMVGHTGGKVEVKNQCCSFKTGTMKKYLSYRVQMYPFVTNGLMLFRHGLVRTYPGDPRTSETKGQSGFELLLPSQKLAPALLYCGGHRSTVNWLWGDAFNLNGGY